MKKIVLYILLFIFYALAVKFYPVIAEYDIKIIEFLQSEFRGIPSWVYVLPDCKLYALLIVFPLIIGFVYFFKKYLLIDVLLFCSSPLAAYLINILVKNIVRRPRPPIELQFAVQPSTFSFVSSHTLVTTSLWGLVIFYVNKYCSNKILKLSVIAFCILWILFVGLSRVMLGVHNFTDVLGGYLLGMILVSIYIKLINLVGGKC